MSRVQRFDRGTLAPPVRLDNGWLRVEGRTARIGILEYDNPDGSLRRELVLPEELFAPASLDSGRMVPVVNTHPLAGLLDSASARFHQVGSVGENLRPDAEYLVAPLMITDGETVKAVEGGRCELSWGYDCELDPANPALVAKFGAHDGIQRKRIYNHLALVDAARAGAGARIRLDAAGNAQHGFATPSAAVIPLDASQSEKSTMPVTIRIDGHAYNTDDPALQQVIDRQLATLRSDGEKAIKIEKDRADAATAKLGHAHANALHRGAIIVSMLGRFDAMKAKMIGCDECGGAGKVQSDGAEMAKCDYCDGKGSVRMHDAIKAAPPAPGADDPEAEEPEDAADPGMVPDDKIDDVDPDNKKQNAAIHLKTGNVHDNPSGDAARKDAAKRRADARKRRADSMARVVERAAKARAALLVEAGGHLGADVKLDGKAVGEIKALVVAKLAPHVKLDGLGAAEVALLYTVETGRVAKARADAPSASDMVRAGLQPVAGSGRTDRQKTVADAIAAAEKAKYHSHERPAK